MPRKQAHITKRVSKERGLMATIHVCPKCYHNSLTIILYNNENILQKRIAREGKIPKETYKCANPNCQISQDKIIKWGEKYVSYKNEKFHLICNMFMKAKIICGDKQCNFVMIVEINKLDEEEDVYGKMKDQLKLILIKKAVLNKMKGEVNV